MSEANEDLIVAALGWLDGNSSGRGAALVRKLTDALEASGAEAERACYKPANWEILAGMVGRLVDQRAEAEGDRDTARLELVKVRGTVGLIAGSWAGDIPAILAMQLDEIATGRVAK